MGADILCLKDYLQTEIVLMALFIARVLEKEVNGLRQKLAETLLFNVLIVAYISLVMIMRKQKKRINFVMNAERKCFKGRDIMEMVSFKVENGESEKITQDAYAHGMNKSEYLRWLIDKHRKEDDGK